MKRKMWKKNKEQGNIIYIFRVDSLCECYDLPRILNLTGHVASSTSPKSVGQVVFVVFVLLFYDSLSVVIKVQTACRYISHLLPLGWGTLFI